MAIDVATSELLAALQGRTAGTFERVKDCEAKAGGRELPPNLKDAIGQATRIKLDKSEETGNIYAYLYASTCEPPEHRGVGCGMFLPLGADFYNSEEENFQNFLGTLKCIKPQYKEWIEASENSQEFWANAFPAIVEDIEKDQPCFDFKTGKERKKGSPNVLIQKQSKSAGYIPPAREGAPNQHQQAGYQAAPGQKAPPGAKAPPGPKSPPGAKAPPGPKAPPGKKAPPGPKKPACPVAVDDFVRTSPDAFGNGQVYEGQIVTIDEAKQEVDIRIGTESGYLCKWTEVTKIEAPTASFSVGQTVNSHPDLFGDGNVYEGEIIAINGDKANVKFAGGVVFEGPNAIPLDKLTAA